MKSYTDIEQSKKLSEILPAESADMHYSNASIEGINYVDEYRVGFQDYNTAIKILSEYITGSSFEGVSGCWNLIPCWSLAALLSILPPYLFEFERGIDLNVYPNLNGKGWHCSYMPNCTENVKKDKFKLMTSEDNLIDACYEMVLKLHEQNIL